VETKSKGVSFDVADEDEGRRRLDVLLAARVEGLSRRQAQKLVARGVVLVDGRPAKKGMIVAAGSRVELTERPPPARWGPLPDGSIDLRVLYEDRQLLALDKPSGVPSVPLAPEEPGTLAGALAARYPECRDLGRRSGDGGLVQRLDRGTSGVVLAARDAQSHASLVALQRGGGIRKTYLALVRDGGDHLPGRIDLPLSPAGVRGRAVKVDPAGMEASTEVVRLRVAGDLLLVRARIHRGRRHQIRVHLAAVGFPIAGDSIYGAGPEPEGIDRLCLHASSVELPHPVTSSLLEVTSPLSGTMKKIIG
jgi:23S rRNA pseudouridine1911/1915/1917 synthase